MSRTIRKTPSRKWMRNPKTTQELRENDAAIQDGIKVRCNRLKRRLPNAWDNKPIAARKEIPIK